MSIRGRIDEQNIINLQREFYNIAEKEIRKLHMEQKKDFAPDDFFAPYRATRDLLKLCQDN